MNPEIKPSLLAVWIILASTTCRLSCDALSSETARLRLDTIPTSNSPFRPLSRFQSRQNGLPLCVYPPPAATALPLPSPSPPSSLGPQPSIGKPGHSLWCVAKANVPVSAMQEALDYACGSGGECGPIQENGPCYKPDTLVAHASYAFNSYWQKTKRAGGTCDFGGSATLVEVDPSYDQCHFVSN